MAYVTLREAAGFLGVSQATLRNWDKAGKLRSVRHPIKEYRRYALADLQTIRARLPFGDEAPLTSASPALDIRSTRTFVSRLHNILRNHDSHSNIIERFDELTKLLFLKLVCEDNPSPTQSLNREHLELNHAYAERIRIDYQNVAEKYPNIVPRAFATLRLSDSAICECATALAQISFKDSGLDVQGLAYEEIIKNTFDKNDNQQFFTPPNIIKFMIEMIAKDLTGAVCDPAAGTGGFLIEILKSDTSVSSLTALEVDERLAWVAGINLFTHGASNAQSYWLPDGGSLGHSAEQFFGKFNAIITNPPFGSDFTDTALLSTYQLGRDRISRRRGILFLERCTQLLKDDGVLAFIIDEGVLNLPSAEDVRRFITENFRIDAIVSLPETAFMPYATVNASILFLRKIKTEEKAKNTLTFFAKAGKVGRKGNGDDDYIYDENGISHTNSDLPCILDSFRSFQQTQQLPSSELAYIADVESNLCKEDVGWRLDFRYHHPSRKLSRSRLAAAKGRLMALSEICEERNQMVIPSSELADQMILYTGLAQIEVASGIAHQVPTPANSLKSAVKRYEVGDILFARMRPNLRKVALMDFDDGGYVSPECIVLTVREDRDHPIVDPLLLSVLLRSDLTYGQIMHLIAGIGRPRLATKDLRRVVIPSANYAAQVQWRSRYLSQMSAVDALRKKARDLLTDASEMERETVEQLAGEFVR